MVVGRQTANGHLSHSLWTAASAVALSASNDLYSVGMNGRVALD